MTTPATTGNRDGATRIPVRVDVGGVDMDALTTDQTVATIIDRASSGQGGWVITANLDHLKRAKTDTTYRAMLEQADLVVADGMPLIWASRLQGAPLPERVAGSSIVMPLAEKARDKGLSLFLLGGNPGVAEQAGAVLCEKYSGLKIVGTHCPPLGFEDSLDEMEAIRNAIISTCPSIVYVALGSPKQERLIAEIRGISPNSWWLGIGISLSFITGEVQRAPLWMQRVGLEWLHRLVQEPRRLMKRYLVDGLPFAVRLGVQAIARRFVRKRR